MSQNKSKTVDQVTSCDGKLTKMTGDNQMGLLCSEINIPSKQGSCRTNKCNKLLIIGTQQ